MILLQKKRKNDIKKKSEAKKKKKDKNKGLERIAHHKFTTELVSKWTDNLMQPTRFGRVKVWTHS